MNEYKDVCKKINDFMHELSRRVVSKEIDIDSARKEANKFILQNDPHKFVNFYESKKYEVVDPSLGGIHHSWEEDLKKYPEGNFLYEIQEDVMDPVSTIRSFDQGKIKDDGTIREINIEDYFKYLDIEDSHNDPNVVRQVKEGERVIKTDIYSMDVAEIAGERTFVLGKSFDHIFVRDGVVEISAAGVNLKVGHGHSCFIPKGVGEYNLKPIESDSVVLKTYLT